MSESETLDITEDLSEAQLAEISFDTEILVRWGNHVGVIVGYEDPEESTKQGSFTVAPVYERHGRWLELGFTPKQLFRSEFVVMGPAQHEPEYRSISQMLEMLKVDLGICEPDFRTDMFVDCMRELTLIAMGDFMSNEPAFKVRLDIGARDSKAHEAESQPIYPRTFRILVRPVMAPIMHDEIRVLTTVAERYGLACSVSNAGIEIHTPDDVVD